mgnify:CR=1 FL=1|jgi:hypothetical protein
MDQLTPFERALLAQFETLARSSEASLKASKAMEGVLRDYSVTAGARMQEIEKRQNAMSAQVDLLAKALDAQTQQTTALVDAVNRLLSARQS